MLHVMSIQTRFLSTCCQLRIEHLLMVSEIHLMIRCSASLRLQAAASVSSPVCCYKPLGHSHKVKSFVVHSSETIKLESEHEKSARKRNSRSALNCVWSPLILRIMTRHIKAPFIIIFLLFTLFSICMRWWPMGPLVGRSNNTSYYYKWILNCLNEALGTWA